MYMKVIATRVLGRELQPGDLFSSVGPHYWDHIDDNFSLGEKVYIRSNTRLSDLDPNEASPNEAVYRITISHDE